MEAAPARRAAGPRAVGVRTPWASVPDRVQGWVQETLGARVVRASDQLGGMSPGCATRLVLGDGSRAFVKAVGRDLNPDTPTLFRRERSVLEQLGRDPLWAGLRAAYDDGDWVALVLEDVDGGHPDLADDDAMSALLESTDRLTATLAERVPDPPAAGDPYAAGPVDVPGRFLLWADTLEAGSLPADLVPRWVCAEAAGWAGLLRALAAPQERRLLHWDLRIDNLLQRADGQIVFVDWGMAGVGPDWVDPLLARLERVEHAWFDASLARSPALARLGDDAVTAWLVGFGTFLAHRAVTAADVGLPTLNAFRRTEAARLLGAAGRRTGR